MPKLKERRKGLFSAIFEYSDRLSGFWIVALCLVSFVCAVANVAVPLLQKFILTSIDLQVDDMVLSLALVAGIGCLFLLFENFINIAIMLRFRRELEYAMSSSLAYKEQPMLKEKGVGVFAAAITGDSEQLSRVLAASWFSIAFNLLGSLVSIVISARWKIYFFVIVLIAYVLMLVVVLTCNTISVHYFKKEKNVSYVLGAKIREMVDTHHSIFAYGSYLDYQKTFQKELDARASYVKRSEFASAASSVLIKLIQTMALVAFFIYAVMELRGMEPDLRDDTYPTIVALVGLFETIFLPVGSLNSTYGNVSKFRAFYDPFRGVIEDEGLGELPKNLNLGLHHVTYIRDGAVILGGVSFHLGKKYGIVGLRGEAKRSLISYLRGESYPPDDGHIELGGARIYEIEKYLRLGLLTFNSSLGDVYGSGLEFNVTMGKPLLSDQKYDFLWKEYQKKLRDFFELVDGETAFKGRKHKALTSEILGDFFALESRMYSWKTVQNHVFSAFESIKDRDEFIATVGYCVFARKYAKRSRYDYLIDKLHMEGLKDTVFGSNGKNLAVSDIAKISLCRFLLMESKGPFVLIDPLAHIPLEDVGTATELILESTKGRKGLIFDEELPVINALSDEIIYFEEGHLIGHGVHAELLKSSKEYRAFINRPKQTKAPKVRAKKKA